jgi:creatinine amidohydrolase/Fe(II)-dependent formamide hydrolase-like protein
MTLDEYLPRRVNVGPWATAYTLNELRQRTDIEFVLPICSLSTPYNQCQQLGQLGSVSKHEPMALATGVREPGVASARPAASAVGSDQQRTRVSKQSLVLPPLFHEALDDQLKPAILARIGECFPSYGADNSARLRIAELPRADLPEAGAGRVLAFSVDTAVEEHGPHLPLATDTIQSYGLLAALAGEFGEIELCRPLEYGQLTWGLPFGFSIDLTADLLSRYVTQYVDALTLWKKPRAIYVVDVHGSITHRTAIVEGIQASRCSDWTFRWLHEPLAEFASERGDQHAGGVETALVERVSPQLLDSRWWPDRIDEIAAGQMSFAKAVELTPDLPAFIQHVSDHSLNGIIGDIRNYRSLDANEMFTRMMSVARRDIEGLLAGQTSTTAGGDLW